MKREWCVAGVVTALFLVGVARAGDEKKAAPPADDKEAKLEAAFKKVDADGDGKLTKDEFKKLAESLPKLKDKPEQADKLDAPRHRYLADALDALLAGRQPEVRATEAPGCALDLGEGQKPTTATITYHNRISRILQGHCVEYHRRGGVAPFALETYDEVVAHKGMIRRVVGGGASGAEPIKRRITATWC